MCNKGNYKCNVDYETRQLRDKMSYNLRDYVIYTKVQHYLLKEQQPMHALFTPKKLIKQKVFYKKKHSKTLQTGENDCEQ